MAGHLQKIQIPENLERIEIIPPDMTYPYFDHNKKVFLKYRKKTFSIQNAWFLAEAAFLSYNPGSFVKYAFYHAGFDTFREFSGKNIARCFAASNSKAAILVFRGTEINSLRMLPGVFADFTVSMVKNETGGRVHSGFKKVLDEIWEGKGMLKEYLAELKNDNPQLKIFITGHSLGGALALIASSRFRQADCVYTFGCPRAGNDEFVKSITAPVYRVVNCYDAITMLPPKKIVNRFEGRIYEHAGELKFIDAEGKINRKIPQKVRLVSKDGIADKPEEEKAAEKQPAGSFDKLINHLIEKLNIDFIDHAPFLYAAKLWNAYIDSSP